VSRVLIVDDHKATLSRGLAVALGQPCDALVSLEEVKNAGDPARWTAAFVDFDLSSNTETGLSIMEYLFDHSPNTKRVVHTSLSDNGRTLFALAAHAWFDVDLIIDKNSDEETLRSAIEPGQNPTPPGWLHKLSAGDDLIEDLLRPGWLDLWRLWPSVNGSAAVAAKRLPGHQPRPRDFASAAIEVVTKYREIFQLANLTPIYERRNSALAVPLTSFAEANSKFFNAPDLEGVLARQDSDSGYDQHVGSVPLSEPE
jgi:hypothetical protein